MRTALFRHFALPILAITVISLAAALPAHADGTVVPWMTGGNFMPDFFNPFSFGGAFYPPNGEVYVTFSVSPTIPDHTLDWICPDQYLCYANYNGSFTGTVTGELYDITDYSTSIHMASFSGPITGGSFEEQAWELQGEFGYWNKYGYGFSGTWTNGFYTEGSGYSSTSSDMNGGWLSVTTYTPEPATIGLLGLGIAGLYSRLRRRS